jgi:NAD(P)-dependent dehydrogenase (short-subunit alcohol dehydrogenase family)
MAERLKGKVVMLTGAGSVGPGWGNGKATAVLFAREGAKIFAIDINLEAAVETRQCIVEEGGECVVHEGDVSKASDVKAMVDHCLQEYGRIDVLHNNVGILEVGGPVEASEEGWDRVTTVNLKSLFLTCKYVIPQMEERGGGAIVNISSIAGIRWLGVPYISYSTTKAGIIQFTKSIALQYAAKHIRCNCILPGLINTPLVYKALADVYAAGEVQKMIEIRDRQCPTGKMGDAWDVAYAALFLASDEAKFITGAQLVVDGGMSCTSV